MRASVVADALRVGTARVADAGTLIAEAMANLRAAIKAAVDRAAESACRPIADVVGSTIAREIATADSVNEAMRPPSVSVALAI
jgi:hypothetical protein